MGSCKAVSFFDAAEGNIPLDHARVHTQGYIRAFPPNELLVRIPNTLGIAEMVYDPSSKSGYNAREQCPFGALVLGSLLWITTPAVTCRAVLAQPFTKDRDSFFLGVHGLQSRRELALATAMYEMFDVLISAIADFGKSGWPMFAALAVLCIHLALTDVSDESIQSKVNGVDAWLASSQWHVPPGARFEAVKAVTQVDDVCGSHWPTAALIAQEFPESMPPVLQWVQRCLAAEGMAGVLTPQWASFWRVLDRLSSEQDVEVSMPDPIDSVQQAGILTNFRMSLLPPHITGSTRAMSSLHYVADRIRAKRHAHCNSVFMGLVNLYAEEKQRQKLSGVLQVVDVGAHLGDCCLWAIARWSGSVLRCQAVERDDTAAAAIERSVSLGGLQGLVSVHRHTVGDFACPADGVVLPGSEVSLDCLLAKLPVIDIIKIHTGGGAELKILAGLSNILHSRRVGVVMVRSTETKPAAIQAFVAEKGWPYSWRLSLTGRDVLLQLVQ